MERNHGNNMLCLITVFCIYNTIINMDVNIIIRITPIGITSLIAVSIANMTRIGSVFEQLGMFVVTVTLGIAIQQLIILPLILFVSTRRNPYLFLITIARPWMMGLATTST